MISLMYKAKSLVKTAAHTALNQANRIVERVR